MPELSPPTCDVKINDAWHTVPLAEAHARHGSAPKRCPVCQGKVMITGAYTARTKLTMVHRKRHDGCPLVPTLFKGIARQHPDAVV